METYRIALSVELNDFHFMVTPVMQNKYIFIFTISMISEPGQEYNERR